MENKRGKFIVLYGINNLGKTTQARLLAEKLQAAGIAAIYLKYPIYGLGPSGPILDNYLRGGNPYGLDPRAAQIIYALNRTQYEKELRKKLEAGTTVVAEDYTGTGRAWGSGAGVNAEFLKQLNSHLLKEDLAFLFDGERFTAARENNHKHETDDALTDRVRAAHLELARQEGWIIINANLTIDEISRQIWSAVAKILPLEKTTAYAPDFVMLHETAKSPAPQNKEITIPAERLNPAAKLPTRAYNHDAGMDLYAAEYYSLPPGGRAVVQTGIRLAIPAGYAGLVWDKGGVAKDGVHAIAGVVDAGFRGEVTVNLVNLGHDLYHIAPGQKIAQLLIQKIETPVIEERPINDDTHRGAGRFGSSGLF